MIEETLAGGNMDPVVRVGGTVRRVAGPWTPAVQRLLGALTAGGVPGIPRPLGLDETGREVLSFLPGCTLAEAEPSVRWSPQALTDAGRLLRAMHDASVPLVDATLVWRTPAHEPAEVICHNDFAPYNLLVHGGRLCGVIDFDMASPGPRIWDLAYLAYRIAPFAEDADYESFHRDDRMQRLRDLIAAYGMPFDEQEVLKAAVERLADLARFTEARANEHGREDLRTHAAMYRRDAERLRDLAG